jgi:hypothetical protein
MAEKLLSQLDQIRDQLSSGQARDLRHSGRLRLAELHLLKFRTSPDRTSDESQADAATARDLLERVARSAGDPVMPYRAHRLLTELLLDTEPGPFFESQLRSLLITDLPGVASDDIRPEFLSVRNSLRKQECDDALRLLNDVPTMTLLQRQQMQWLKLESLLGRRQLVEQLNDEQMITEANSRFHEAVDSVQRLATGVFRDAMELTLRRFELVEAVGVPVADLIEQIEQHRAEGRPQEALRRIDMALTRLAPNALSRSRAALQLHAGELFVDQQQWPQASERLSQAAEMYEKIGQPSEQAATDLLRIFVFAQRLREQAPDVTRSDYLAALNKHLTRFPTEATAATAREWLLQMTTEGDPAQAIALLQLMVAEETDAAKRTELLRQQGRLLLTRPPSEANEILIEQFRRDVQRLTSADAADGKSSASLEFVLLQLDMQRDATADWSQAQQRLERIIAAQNHSDETTDAVTERFHTILVHAVIAARLRHGSSAQADIREAQKTWTAGQIAEAIDWFYRYYAPPELRTGDQLLARINETLLQQAIADHLQTVPLSDVVKWLKIARRTSALTNNSEVPDQILNHLVGRELKTEHLQEIANAMAENTSVNHVGDDKLGEVESQFWRRVLQVSCQGDDSWLEASLRLADLAASSGDTRTAQRQLGVVEALYPDWGNDDRRQRAQRLKTQLSP